MQISGLLRAMEKMYEPQEEAFEFARVLYDFQKTCPEHNIGVKDLDLQRYVCPICNLALARSLK